MQAQTHRHKARLVTDRHEISQLDSYPAPLLFTRPRGGPAQSLHHLGLRRRVRLHPLTELTLTSNRQFCCPQHCRLVLTPRANSIPIKMAQN